MSTPTSKPNNPPAKSTDKAPAPAPTLDLAARLVRVEDDLGAAIRELGLVREKLITLEGSVRDALVVWSKLDRRVDDTQRTASKLEYRFNTRYPEVWSCPACRARLQGPEVRTCPRCERQVEAELVA